MTLVGLMLATGTFKPLRDCKERQDYITPRVIVRLTALSTAQTTLSFILFNRDVDMKLSLQIGQGGWI
jgi:hypothetical protein